jgi:hypothetical protein
MKKHNILLLVLILFTTAKAQISEVYFGTELFRFSGYHLAEAKLSTSTGITVVRNSADAILGAGVVGYGHSFPLLKKGRKFNLVANPAAMCNFLFPGTIILGLKTPLNVIARFGPHIDEKISSGVSFGIGGGVTYSALYISEEFFRDKTSYFAPSAVVEVGKRTWKIRVDAILTKHTTHYKSYTGDIPHINYLPRFALTYVGWWFIKR